ncbi:hypothetical protein PV04_07512 [Phialophora macrospora]|uniref:Uncharacterized protein n=1 Tax=Phialophora macrospora TaxID=1851006 RepID=A0A0D2DSU1_9EURO|nr:hypothetical protein PV04_07512 [Phialophora macrospora]
METLHKHQDYELSENDIEKNLLQLPDMEEANSEPATDTPDASSTITLRSLQFLKGAIWLLPPVAAGAYLSDRDSICDNELAIGCIGGFASWTGTVAWEAFVNDF